MKYLIYCTQAKPYLVSNWVEDHEDYKPQRVNFLCDKKQALQSDLMLNGKIVAEFDGECGEIKLHNAYALCTMGYHTFVDRFYSDTDLQKASCLNGNELMWYLKGEEDNEKVGYAIHIKNLKIFDKPLELNDLVRNCLNDNCLKCKNFDSHSFCPTRFKKIEKAPQNMCWVWHNGELKVLISIRSNWVCKIANGEKTIEVRKKVLKGCL